MWDTNIVERNHIKGNIMTTKNLPKIANKSIYEEIEKYQSSRGFKFDLEAQPRVTNFLKHIDEPCIKVATALLNTAENAGKSKRATIDGPDFEGMLVQYKQEHEMWTDDEGEYIYFLTYNKRIVKIGMTVCQIAGRWGSYNCGTRKAMRKGSCSSTNFIISECNYTALRKGMKVEIYGIKIPRSYKKITRFNQTQMVAVSVARDLEEMVTNEYINKYKDKPVLCVQKGNNFEK